MTTFYGFTKLIGHSDFFNCFILICFPSLPCYQQGRAFFTRNWAGSEDQRIVRYGRTSRNHLAQLLMKICTSFTLRELVLCFRKLGFLPSDYLYRGENNLVFFGEFGRNNFLFRFFGFFCNKFTLPTTQWGEMSKAITGHSTTKLSKSQVGNRQESESNVAWAK